MKRNKSKWMIAGIMCLTITIPAAQSMRVSAAKQFQVPDHTVYLPLIFRPMPAPWLNPITNPELDNFYTVSWAAVNGASAYILEEATEAAFASPTEVYAGNGLSWTVPDPGKTPATYYYRVRAADGSAASDWSNIQSVTIYPLFVGLRLRWDGIGYIRVNGSYDVGFHETMDLLNLSQGDIIESENHAWYDPNPGGWAASSSLSYYSVTTGEFVSTSDPLDPAWKFHEDWILPYSVQLVDGGTYIIENEVFLVSGPHSGTNAFGRPAQYWELVNRDKFLYWIGSGGWKNYVHPGDIVLRYDAGNTRLELYSSILRRYYFQGNLTSNTAQYVVDLTSANSYAGSPPAAGLSTQPIPARAPGPRLETGTSPLAGPRY